MLENYAFSIYQAVIQNKIRNSFLSCCFFGFCFFSLLGQFRLHVYHHSAFVFAGDETSPVPHVRHAGRFVYSKRGGRERIVRSPVVAVAFCRTHSYNHSGDTIASVTKKGNLLAPTYTPIRWINSWWTLPGWTGTNITSSFSFIWNIYRIKRRRVKSGDIVVIIKRTRRINWYSTNVWRKITYDTRPIKRHVTVVWWVRPWLRRVRVLAIRVII